MVLPGKKVTPEGLLRAFRRRKWSAITTFLVVAAGTAIVAEMLPDRYRSETLLLVVPQRVPESYVRATVTTRLEDRLRSIQAQILSRTKLEQIIRDSELYPDLRSRLPMEDVVERMRTNDVRVELVRGDAFRVSFTSEHPRKAMEVAQRLATLFVDESMQDREVLANATTQFLQSQLEEARRTLVEAEGKVADFQRRHAGALPSERDSNLTVLHNLELQVQALLDSMNREKDRQLFLERTLSELESEAKAISASMTAGSAGDIPAAVPGATPADQLEAARKTLKNLELRLKPEHPDVVFMRRVIKDLEAKVASEAALTRPEDGSGRPGSQPSRGRTPEEAAVLGRIQETRQELAGVQIQIASKLADEKRLREQIAAYQRRLEATPGLAAEFTALTRDYDTLRAGYASLLSKYEDAKAASALEQRQIGEQFKMLDPARLPESPISPNRPLIDLMGVLAAAGLAFGLVALFEYQDRTLRTEADVLAVLSTPVLASIPVIRTSVDRARTRRRRIYGLAGAAAAVVLIAGSAIAVWVVGFQRLSRMFR